VTAPVTRDGSDAGLAPRAIGLREVLFQSVTAMAPTGALAVSVVVGATFAGGALTLAVIFAFIPCLTVAISIGQLAKHLPSAGSIYTYPARALHPTVGFLVGWGYALAAATWGPTIALMTSVQIAGVMTPGGGKAYQVVWIATFVAAAIVVLLLGYYGVQVSARVGTILGAIEICIFLFLAAWLIAVAGPTNTRAPFGLGLATVKGYEGILGVFAAAVYTVQAFVGFEAAAPLAEEARDGIRMRGNRRVLRHYNLRRHHRVRPRPFSRVRCLAGTWQSLVCPRTFGLGRGMASCVLSGLELEFCRPKCVFQRFDSDLVCDGSHPFAPGRTFSDPSTMAVTTHRGAGPVCVHTRARRDLRRIFRTGERLHPAGHALHGDSDRGLHTD